MIKSEKAKLNRKIYMIWYHIKERCYISTHPCYKNYGAKGVVMCDEWKDFSIFKKEIKEVQGYSDEGILNGLIHLDKDYKIQGNKIYSKDTCVFLDKIENNKYKPNQMKSFIATSPDGEEFEAFNQSDFARLFNLNQSTISECLKGKIKKHKGWSFRYNK